MRTTPENIQFIATDHGQPKGIIWETDGCTCQAAMTATGKPQLRA